MKILFENVCIVTMDNNNTIINDGYLEVNDNYIRYIGKEKPNNDYDQIIDGTNKVIMPGLINAHTHSPMTLLKGYAEDKVLEDWLFNYILPIEKKLDDRCIEVGTTLAVAEMLKNGITSFSDMYFKTNIICEVVKNTGIKANICNPMTTFDEVYNHNDDRAYSEFMYNIKNYHNYDSGRIKLDAGIHAHYTSTPDSWIFWRDIAKKYNVLTHIHLSESITENQSALDKTNMTPTELLNSYHVFDNPVLLAHCVHLTDNDIEILSHKENVTISHNPIANLKLGSGIANINNYIKANINIALGTDGLASNNNYNMFEEIKMSSLLAKGINHDASLIDAKTALSFVTVNGAKAQGRTNTGQLKEGYDADIIMINFDDLNKFPNRDVQTTLVHNTVGSDVLLTMVMGKILYHNNEFKTIDIDKLKKDVIDISVLKLHV